MVFQTVDALSLFLHFSVQMIIIIATNIYIAVMNDKEMYLLLLFKFCVSYA